MLREMRLTSSFIKMNTTHNRQKESGNDKYIRNNRVAARDASRLVQEGVEELGELVEGKEGVELICLLRRVIRAGVEVVKNEQNTVSLREAAWYSVNARAGLRPTSLRDLRNYVRRILRVKDAEDLPLRVMSTHDCRRILQTAFGNSRSSYVKGRAVLSSIFSYGIRQEWCDSNPVARIEVPKVMETPKAPLDSDEVQRLISASEAPRFRNMRFSVRLLLYAGIRPTEVSRIRPEDICWDEKQLIIRTTTSKTGGGRLVPMRRLEGLRESDCTIPRNWAARWRDLRRAAGFSNWVPDVCRHTFASYHAAYFRNLPALQLEMGHRDVSLLRSRYVSPTLRSKAVSFWNESKRAGGRSTGS